MYADEFQSINNRQNILDFFKRVAEDGRFEELAMELGLTNCQTQGERNNIVEQLTAFAVHLQKRGAFRDDLCMDFEHEAQSFIEMQNNKEL